MNISAPFIARPIATFLLMLALLAAGLVGYNLLPVAALPNVDIPTLNVTASLPGADPETMAASVAQPLERQFADLPHPDHFDQRSGQHADHAAIRFVPQHRRRCIGRAGGDQRRAGEPAKEPSEPADLQEGQSR